MVRAGFTVAGVALAGFLLTSLIFGIFGFIMPMVLWMLKVAVFVAVAYFLMRLLNPEFAERMKEKCCGSKGE